MFICFNVCDKDTFENAKKWGKESQLHLREGALVYAIALQCDRYNQAQVTIHMMKVYWTTHVGIFILSRRHAPLVQTECFISPIITCHFRTHFCAQLRCTHKRFFFFFCKSSLSTEFAYSLIPNPLCPLLVFCFTFLFFSFFVLRNGLMRIICHSYEHLLSWVLVSLLRSDLRHLNSWQNITSRALRMYLTLFFVFCWV